MRQYTLYQSVDRVTILRWLSAASIRALIPQHIGGCSSRPRKGGEERGGREPGRTIIASRADPWRLSIVWADSLRNTNCSSSARGLGSARKICGGSCGSTAARTDNWETNCEALAGGLARISGRRRTYRNPSCGRGVGCVW